MIKLEVNKELIRHLECSGDMHTILCELCLIISKIAIHFSSAIPGVKFEDVIDIVTELLLENKKEIIKFHKESSIEVPSDAKA